MSHWVCTDCHSINDARVGRCYKCRARRPEGAPVPVDAAAARAAGELAGRPGPLPRADPAPREPSLVGAFVFGLVVAVIATAAWVAFEAGVGRFQGRLAWLLGLLIALATVTGARGRTSFLIVLMSTLLAVVAVVAGEYLILSARLAGVVPGVALVVATPQQVSDAIAGYLRTDPLRIILWLLAVGTAFGIPWGRLTESDGERDRWGRP